VEFTVRFLPSGRVVRVPAGTSLLHAAREAGLPVASGCGENRLCALCGLEIVEGIETLPPESDAESQTKKLGRIDPKLRLSCHLEIAGDLVVTAQYW
jgi:ferredoxin